MIYELNRSEFDRFFLAPSNNLELNGKKQSFSINLRSASAIKDSKNFTLTLISNVKLKIHFEKKEKKGVYGFSGRLYHDEQLNRDYSRILELIQQSRGKRF